MVHLTWATSMESLRFFCESGKSVQYYQALHFPSISHLETDHNTNSKLSMPLKHNRHRNNQLLLSSRSKTNWSWMQLQFFNDTALVNMSVGFWFPWIFLSDNTLSSKSDFMKWYLNCICFVLEWNTGFFARCITLRLSLYRTLFFCFLSNSSKKLCNQIISLLTSITAT